MSIIEKAKQHFRDRMSGGLSSVDVPEWDTTIYFKPSMSLRQQSPISKLISEGKTEEALVRTLIIRALDEEGQPLFRSADSVELMTKCDPNVIAKICTAMNEDDSLTTEEAGND